MKHWAAVNEIDLAPGFLLSMPQLADPNFTRAVVLMIDHDDSGSFGLIVNHPSEIAVAELLQAIESEWGGGEGEKVLAGGPVMPSSGWCLHTPSEWIHDYSDELQTALEVSGSMRIRDELFLSTSEEKLRALASDPPEDIRFLLGYSGWGPGQLASEMARGSWLHADLDLDILFHCPPDEMWERALASLGIDPEAIVQSKGIH